MSKQGVRCRIGVVFAKATPYASIATVQEALEKAQLIVARETIEGAAPTTTTYLEGHAGVALSVTASRDRLEAYAELLGLLKAVTDSPVGRKEPFCIRDGASFVRYTDGEMPDRFFSSSEELYLLHELMTLALADVHVHDMELLPLHDKAEKTALWQRFRWSLYPSNSALADATEGYFGPKVALYFAWLHHLTLFLSGPAVLGGLLALYESLAGIDEADDAAVSPLFTLFTVLWSAVYLQYWQRRSAALVCRWGILEADAKRSVRPEFTGVPHTNVFSGHVSLTYPYYYRMYKYVGSAAVTAAMLVLAVLLMVVSLNFQGYVHPESLGGSYLHLPFVHQFSLPGAVFDQQGGGPWPYVLPYLPVLVHCSCILFLNKQYRGVALALTQWENHATTEAFENAYVLKRFFFEAFDCYIALFYLAFCQLDVVLLKAELMSLYMADTFRRLGLETLLPLVLKYTATREDSAMHKKTEDATLAKVQLVKETTAFDEYEPFDDYLEKVIEFGYITLFASCFPLASALSIVSNLVEIKSDQFKLIYLLKRPSVERATSIGIWQAILTGLVWLSVVTNVFLFGFTTDQLAHVRPAWFTTIAVDDAAFGGVDHLHVAAAGQGMHVMGFVFGVEHVLFLLVLAISKLIPSVPDSVVEENHRRQQALVLVKHPTAH
ncbi:anoctamin-8-like [Achlya hypogyna]|uniref:Anoctamin-8-like n=1 Tax=Achlya hypogyna TaxID=1202772 RepID=A0A1V9YFJ3_ACHHY|nr:anoctamin-8-like [Achlya hypogyna]